MKTIQVSNGDIVISNLSGQIKSVEGIDKGAQDVARALLLEFDGFFQHGNELLTTGIGLLANEALVQQFLIEAVNRLISVQNTDDPSTIITGIVSVKTKPITPSTMIFLLEVGFGNGKTKSIVDVFRAPTQLDQVSNPVNLSPV